MQGKISVGSSAFAIGAYKEKPIPFDEVARRLLSTPPQATRKPKAKRAKSK